MLTVAGGLKTDKQMLKDIQDWEREYNGMDVPRTKREQQILEGDPYQIP